MTATPLSAHDSAIWRTVWINDLMDRDRLAEVPSVSTVMAPSIGEGERVVADGRFTLLDFIAGGDGSYVHKSGGGFIAMGRPAFIVGSAAGMALGAAARAAGNSNRRNAAWAAAQKQWRQIDVGGINISQFGFYLHTVNGIHVWNWWSISAAELVAPGQVSISGDSQNGAIRWIVQSEWAELIFTMWARARHPQHPQFLAGRWVPPGWADRVRASEYDLPHVSDGRWTHVVDGPQPG